MTDDKVSDIIERINQMVEENEAMIEKNKLLIASLKRPPVSRPETRTYWS